MKPGRNFWQQNIKNIIVKKGSGTKKKVDDSIFFKENIPMIVIWLIRSAMIMLRKTKGQ